jgi:hypothetical protein
MVRFLIQRYAGFERFYQRLTFTYFICKILQRFVAGFLAPGAISPHYEWVWRPMVIRIRKKIRVGNREKKLPGILNNEWSGDD